MFWSVFPALGELCLLAVHYYFDYYYYWCCCLWLLFVITVCLRLALQDFFCPFMPLQKKNKLLLLLFHRNLDSEMFYPYLSSFCLFKIYFILYDMENVSFGGFNRRQDLQKHWCEHFWEEYRNMRMRCGFLFGSKALNIHSHSDFEDLTVRSAAFFCLFTAQLTE